MAGRFPTVAALPLGTQVEHDGIRATKVYASEHEPFPWLDHMDGTQYSDEWASRVIAEGAAVSETKE